MAFIGNTNTTQAFTPAIDYFSGNGSTTAFTLSRPVASVAQVQVVVNNVAQNPSSAYTVSGNTITFTSAPSSGTNNIYVYYTSPITQVVALPQNPQVFGNLQFSSSGARITGDFSNATVANRVMFQTSTTNGNTVIGLIPNGTATTCAFVMDTDPALTNSSTGSFNLVASTDVRLTAGIRGTGTYLPMAFYTGGSERMRIDTSGNVGIGTSSPNGLIDVASNSNSTVRYYFRNASAGTGAYTILDLGNDTSNLRGELFVTSSGNTSSWGANSLVLSNSGAFPILFSTNNTEQARITAAGLFQFNSGYGSVATAYGCRAWVNFNGTGTVAIRASGNVTSITDNGVGSYAVNLTNAMPDTNYACVMATKGSSGAGTPFLPLEHASLAARTTSSIAFYVIALNGSTPDADVVEVAFFR